MLRKKTNGVARRSQRTSILSDVAEKSVDRRAFLRGSGLAIGGLAAISATGGMVSQASAQSAVNGAVETVKSVCTHQVVPKGGVVMAHLKNRERPSTETDGGPLVAAHFRKNLYP